MYLWCVYLRGGASRPAQVIYGVKWYLKPNLNLKNSLYIVYRVKEAKTLAVCYMVEQVFNFDSTSIRWIYAYSRSMALMIRGGQRFAQSDQRGMISFGCRAMRRILTHTGSIERGALHVQCVCVCVCAHYVNHFQYLVNRFFFKCAAAATAAHLGVGFQRSHRASIAHVWCVY